MANELTANYDTIQRTIALELGWDRDSSQWTPANNSDFGLIVDEGMRQFYGPPILPNERKSHNWSFLFPLGTMKLSSGFELGTVSVVSGTATFTDDLPDWIVDGSIAIHLADGVKYFDVLARVSGTELTLDPTVPDSAAGTKFHAYRRFYDLPEDFGGMHSDEFTISRHSQYISASIRLTSERAIRDKSDSVSGIGGFPSLAALTTVAPDATRSSRTRVTFWPLVQGDWDLEFRYIAIPPRISASFPYHYGSAFCSEAVIASCVDRAYQRIHASQEKHSYFMDRLSQAIMHDRRNFDPSNLGPGTFSEGGGGFRSELNHHRRNIDPGNIHLDF